MKAGVATAVACALAAALAALSLLPIRSEALLVGQPGDGSSIAGFAAPSTHLDEPGRWTRGAGLLRLPASPLPAVVTLHLAAPDARVPDEIRVLVSGMRAHRHTLASAGWNDVDIAIDSQSAANGLELLVQSGVTGGDGERGVFISRATVTTGGLAALRHTRPGPLVCLWLTWLGVVIVSWPRPLARSVGILLAMTALVYFRMAVLPHLAVMAVLTAAVALVATGVTFISARRVSETGDAGPSRVRTILLFGTAAAALVFLLFPEAFVQGRVLSQADALYEHYPWRAHQPQDHRLVDRPPLGDVPMLVYPFGVFTQSRLWRASLPLWTSAAGAGQPFLATYQSALFSPFTLVSVVAPFPQATVVVAALRLLVAGLGMFLFLRALGLSRLAAAFGGITFELSPFLLVWLEHPLAGVPPWLPWMLLAGEHLGRVMDAAQISGRGVPGRAVAMLAFTTALVLTGGHPHTGLFVAMLGAAYALARAAASTGRRRIGALTWAAAALALGAALTALQVLPFLEYVSLSRAAAERANYPLNPFIAPASTLITAIVPNFLGHHIWGNFAGPTNYLEQQIYPGIATWMAAAVGLVAGVRTWRVWFFGTTTVIAMLVMYGAPIVHQLVSSLPLIGSASLPRAGIVALAGLCVLASIGVDEILREPPSRRWLLTLALVAAGAALAAVALAMVRMQGSWLDERGLLEFTTRWTWLTVWLAAAVAAVAIGRVWDVHTRTAAGVMLCALAALDLLVFGRGFHQLAAPPHVFPLVPSIRHVQNDPGLFRVLGAGGALTPNAAMAYRLQDVRAYDGLLVARYADLLDVILRYEHHTHTATGLFSPLIDLLNVKYVFGTPRLVVPDGWFTRVDIEGDAPLYRNNRVLPRAFLVDGYVVQDGNTARRTLRDGRVDFHRVALLEQDLPQGLRPAAATAAETIGGATVTRYGDHHVEIVTDAPAPRLLVLMDVHYPGWEAEVDGQPALMPRANFAFRGVPVPAGRHTVTFDYRPLSWRIGWSISAAALASCALLVAFERRYGRRLASLHTEAKQQP